MAAPIDTASGRIVGYDERTQELMIRARYDDWYAMTKREYKSCLVQLVDSRPLSEKQRRACYALLREISNYTGMGDGPTKEWMKLKFIVDDLGETADKIFSLRNAPMSLVCAFQRFLVRFIVDWDIPCSFSLLNFVDDVQDYIYACLISKKCCITGRKAQLHHIDRVGMGRNRNDIVHEGMEVLPLSPEMHMEAHSTSDQDFFKKYHLNGGIMLDKTLCRIWKLKRSKEEKL